MMLEASFESIFAWVSLHPHWSGGIVFLVALAESLAVVGLVIPGVAMMFMVGALIGAGALSFAPMCLWAIAGAVAGDGISFWLGRRFHGRLGLLWPFRSHPKMLQEGVRFFRRYGGRSLLFGRFVGPVRAAIPLVAGMLDMPPGRFLAVNLFSALLWAPAYLFPGVVFGASLELASKVAGRLVILLILLVASLWLAAWCSKRLYTFLQPRTHRFIDAIFDWTKHHPIIAKLTNPVLDPRQRDYISLVVFALILTVTGQQISHFVPDSGLSIQHLRTPWADAFFTFIAGFAGYPSIILLFLLIVGWLVLTRHATTLIHWVFALLYCVLSVDMVQLLFDGAKTVDGGILRAGVMYGFVAVLLAGPVSPAWSRLIYSSISLFCVTIIIARIYLGAASFTTAALTVLMTLTWLGILGIAYRRHKSGSPSSGGLAMVMTVALLIIYSMQFGIDRKAAGPSHHPIRNVSASFWWRRGWKQLPAYRDEIFSIQRQPLTIQWAAAADADDIRAVLIADGWRQPVALTLKHALYWLNPRAATPELPILPHFFLGQHEAILLIKPADSGRYLVLRLWASTMVLEGAEFPVWIGRAAYLKHHVLFSFFNYLDESDPDQEAFQRFSTDIRRHFADGAFDFSMRDDGSRTVLLIRSPDSK